MTKKCGSLCLSCRDARRKGMQVAFNEVADFLDQHGLKSYAAIIRERSNGLSPGPFERAATAALQEDAL